MRKNAILSLILALLVLVGLSGCAEADALRQGRWQRVEPMPEGAAAEFLSALDFTAEEIALADPAGPGIVRQVSFTAGGEYRFSCHREATRALVRAYLDDFFTALCADPAALAPVYDASHGADMAALDPEGCRAFYAGIFGCADYAALLDHLTDAFYDYEALAAWEETGDYSLRGSRLYLSDPEGNDRGYVEFELTENALTLYYAQGREEYRNFA